MCLLYNGYIFIDIANNDYSGEYYLPFITGEFGIVYRAHLTISTLRKTESEIVAVKTIKGEDMIGHGVHCMSTTGSCLPLISVSLIHVSLRLL